MTNSDIVKHSDLLITLLKSSDFHQDLKVGDFLLRKDMHSYTLLVQVTDIQTVKKKKWEKGSWVDTEEDELEILVQPFDIFTLSPTQDRKHRLSPTEFTASSSIRYSSLEELSKDLDQAQSSLLEGRAPEIPEEEQQDQTFLAVRNKDLLVNRKNSLEGLYVDLERSTTAMELIIKRHQMKLESLRHKMNENLSLLRKQISRLEDAIFQIELYCGIKEEVKILRMGTPSSEKIRFYQETLYMDEEVGDWKDGGISVETIDDFDNWFLRNNHLDLFIQGKGVRLFQARRDYKKRYIKNGYLTKIEIDKNGQDIHTYILIRNGECIYRIWTQLQFGDKLFPDSDELQKLLGTNSSFSEDMAYRKISHYRKNFLVLQGLLDRSDVLSPHASVNLFETDILKNDVFELVYDKEFRRLPSGFKSFFDFRREINSKITEGTRVFFLEAPHFYDDHDRHARFDYVYSGDTPELPRGGVYTVYHKQNKWEKEPKTVIHYLPEDKVFKSWRSGYVDRKKKVSFVIHKSDDFIINYDELTIEDVEFLS